MSTAARAYVVLPDEGERISALGLTAIEKIRSADSGGACYAFEVICSAGYGIPPHRHRHEDEVLYVIDGEYDVVLGDERVRAGPGCVLNFTRGTVHGFQGLGTPTSRALHVVTPGTSFEHFLHELVHLPAGPPDVSVLAALFDKYGMSFCRRRRDYARQLMGGGVTNVEPSLHKGEVVFRVVLKYIRGEIRGKATRQHCKAAR